MSRWEEREAPDLRRGGRIDRAAGVLAVTCLAVCVVLGVMLAAALLTVVLRWGLPWWPFAEGPLFWTAGALLEGVA